MHLNLLLIENSTQYSTSNNIYLEMNDWINCKQNIVKYLTIIKTIIILC